MSLVLRERGICGAEGGIRTHTPVKVADFKSAASAISPPRQANNKMGDVEDWDGTPDW